MTNKKVESLQAKEAAHTSEAAERWCQKKLPKFIPKEPLQQQTHLI